MLVHSFDVAIEAKGIDQQRGRRKPVQRSQGCKLHGIDVECTAFDWVPIEGGLCGILTDQLPPIGVGYQTSHIMHIDQMQRAARAFRPKLDAVKRAAPQIDWFFGDILGNIDAIGGLLGDGTRDVFERFAGGRVADMGAADGDLAFFLESLGYRPEIIDFPDYNYNRLEAAYHLKQALDSSVPIHEIDLDSRFDLPSQYDAVIFLGLLYHLKTPYFVLEMLAHSSRYCILSTRIARWLRSGFWPWQFGGHIRNKPVAYLLDPDECNNDSTNYWIFSEAGLRRVVERAGWRILDFRTYGRRWTSNPRDGDRDERAFMLLESRHF
jgi:2-polyprenyl-3-methyl-5-hydroxy-6-metoxy-1,4-benzoquinol methylase